MSQSNQGSDPETKTKVNQTNFLKSKPRFNALVLSFLVVAFSIGGYFVYSSFASEGPTEFNDKAEVESQVKALTSSVKLRSAKYANSRRNHSSDETKNKDTVAHVTAQRRLAMRKLMLKKPELASKYVLPDEAKNDLPDEAKGQVESRISVEGTWVISEDERFDSKTGRIVSSKNIYSIQTDKTSYNLTNTTAPKGIQHASTVKVEGVTIDGMMAANKDGIVDKVTAQAINQKVAQMPAAAKMLGVEQAEAFTIFGVEIKIPALTPYVPPATGNRTVAVYLINFQDDVRVPTVTDNLTNPNSPTQFPVTTASIQSYLQTNPTSVANFYRTQSRGRFTPTFTVHDWYTVPASSTTDCTNYASNTLLTDPVLDNASDAIDRRDGAAAAGNRIFLINDVRCTNGTQIGNIGATGQYVVPPDQPGGNRTTRMRYILNTVVTTVMGRPIFSSPGLKWFTSTIAHEMGHNLGLAHAMKDTPQCVPSLTTTCDINNELYTTREYGDVYDAMGYGDLGESMHFNGFHQMQLGWYTVKNYGNTGTQDYVMAGPMDPYSPATVSTSGELLIAPIEVGNTNDLSNISVARVWSYQNGYNEDKSPRFINLEYRQRVSNPTFDTFNNFSTGIFDKSFDPEPGVLIYDTKVISSDITRFTSLLRNPIYGSQNFSGGHILRLGQTYDDPIHRIKFTFMGTTTMPNGTVAARVKREITRDSIPPAQPTNIKITPIPGALDVSWTNPADTDYMYSYFKIYKLDTRTGVYSNYCALNASRNYKTNRMIINCNANASDPNAKYFLTMYSQDQWGNISPETTKLEFKPLVLNTILPTPTYSAATHGPKIEYNYYARDNKVGIRLSWPSIQNATSYKIRRTDGVTATTSGSTYTDTNIEKNKIYYYSISPIYGTTEYYPFGSSGGICSWQARTFQWLCGPGGEGYKYSYINNDPNIPTASTYLW